LPHSLCDDNGVSNPSTHPDLHQVVERAIAQDPTRRRLMLSGFGAASLPFLAGLGGCGGSDDAVSSTPATPTPVSERMLGFQAVATSSSDTVVVPAGYVATAIIPWGEPINSFGPAFAPDASNTASQQERQIGDNHDGMHFFGFDASTTALGQRSDEGLLVLNHEYINPEYFYAPGADLTDHLLPFDLEKARKGQAAHGISIVHVRRAEQGRWEHVKDSRFNRRIHGNTPQSMQGPAAGNALVQTPADASGLRVLGTLNNCGAGRTPWGTYITCEENFNGYFGNTDTVGRVLTSLERRYGVGTDAGAGLGNGFGYRWHTVDARFDIQAVANEPNRFGWVVEVDPFNTTSTPVKRTALGRFKHENAECVIASSGRVVVYSGDDERNEYVYKFVSSGTFDAANPTSTANRNLLSEGTLFVARFDAGATVGDRMGTGVWIPLVHNQNGLTPANGFADQGEVLIKTRQAADRVGATMMDRPEWVAANTKKAGEVYVTMTNNNRRGGTPASSNLADGTTTGGSARPPVDEANPRANNAWGHIVRFNEAGGDGAATTFTWDIFVLAGQPSITGARAASANINADNLFNSPDGLAFDSFGRMWIQTDGNFSNVGDFAGMGNNQMLASDPATGEIRRFLVGPSGCEVTGIDFTPDRKTMFINIQHPGELGNHPNAPRVGGTLFTDAQIARDPTRFSQWPVAGMRPRSATVVVTRTDGREIGG